MGEPQTESVAPTTDTLGQMLYLLNATDQGLEELQPDKLKELFSDLSDKVDSYKYMLEKFDMEVARLKNRIAEYQSTKKTLENNRKALLDLMKYHMEEKGFQKLPGNDYVASLVKRRDAQVKTLQSPSAADYRKWPAFVKREYSWSVSSLKEAIKQDPEGFKSFGEVVETSYLTFKVRKGVTND